MKLLFFFSRPFSRTFVLCRAPRFLVRRVLVVHAHAGSLCSRSCSCMLVVLLFALALVLVHARVQDEAKSRRVNSGERRATENRNDRPLHCMRARSCTRSQTARMRMCGACARARACGARKRSQGTRVLTCAHTRARLISQNMRTHAPARPHSRGTRGHARLGHTSMRDWHLHPCDALLITTGLVVRTRSIWR